MRATERLSTRLDTSDEAFAAAPKGAAGTILDALRAAGFEVHALCRRGAPPAPLALLLRAAIAAPMSMTKHVISSGIRARLSRELCALRVVVHGRTARLQSVRDTAAASPDWP